MMTALSFRRIECSDPVGFLDAISDLSRSSENQQALWRGAGKEGHELVPRAFRREGRATLVRNVRTLSIDEHEIPLVFLEWYAIAGFYTRANQQRLSLPPVSSDLHHLLVSGDHAVLLEATGIESDMALNWPPKELLPTIALAQHYGIPTRLLDWTSDPLVAAYFAAREGMKRLKNRRPDSEPIVVWWTLEYLPQLTASLSPGRCKAFVGKGSDPKCRIHLVDAPYSGNPNLAAQRGRFTLVSVDRDHSSLSDQTPFDQVVEHVEKTRAENTSGVSRLPLAKLVLPVELSPALLVLLAERRCTASELFPGFHGCALGWQERVEVQSAAHRWMTRIKKSNKA